MAWVLGTTMAAARGIPAEDAAGELTGKVEVTGVKAVHRNGQTFVTWKDVAEGEEAAAYRYTVYRSDKPIGPDLAEAEVCVSGILYNSAKLFGHAFNKKDRLDPSKPTAILEEGGRPLPMWSGLAAITVKKDGRSCYAVAATDENGKTLSSPSPGRGATTEPVEERIAPIQPILYADSKSRKGPYIQQTCVSGEKGLPLHVNLHASAGQGGGAAEYGDYYLYFSRPEWGWQDGMPGVFSVQERKDGGHRRLVLDSRDAIVTPAGGPMETYWFGYVCIPQWWDGKEPRAWNFTERRMLWIIDWVIKKYGADPDRVCASGGSMGAWGSTTFALRHPEIFAAVYPNRPRTRQLGMPSLVKISGKKEEVLIWDGSTTYFERMDMVKFVLEHRDDLPFYCWCCGRRDGFATWQEQVDMAKAMKESRHGFAFAWNDGDHSSGAQPMGRLLKYYGPDKFARNISYPAFSNSSIDDDPGPGDPAAGDKEGGINLGFLWKDVVDEEDKWSVRLANDLCKAEMTVDVTPRRCQKFKPKPGEKFKWANSAGGGGDIEADRWGLVTAIKVRIPAGGETVLAISR